MKNHLHAVLDSGMHPSVSTFSVYKYVSRKVLSFLLAACLLMSLPTTGFGQNVNVNPGAGTFSTLKEAFDAINLGSYTGAITIDIVNNTTETASAVLNASGTGSSSYTSILIQPSGGAGRTITGSITSHLISFDGADNVTIDGLNSGGNSLTIANTSVASGNTIHFINDASTNTIQNCTLQGSSSIAANAVLFFNTGLTTGNDGNTVFNCNITGVGANLPVNGIYSAGTSTAIDNSGNIVNQNNIYDFFSPTSASQGINITSNGNSGWTITNNRLYQTANRIFTAATTHSGISIGIGSGYTITGNTIGFANAAGTGTTNLAGITTAGTFSGTFPGSYALGTATLNATRYVAINCAFTTGGTVSEIQNNTIGGFALLTSSPANTTNGIWCGINVISGNANIGTTTGNTIGSTSGVSSVYTACSATGGTAVGIYSTSVNTISIQNNNIGGIDAVGTSATLTGGFTGIDVAGAAGVFSITNNNIGNTAVDNIRTGYTLLSGNLSNAGVLTSSTGATSAIMGIRNSSTGATLTITGNTIRGIATSGTVTPVTGILSSGAITATITINGNFLGTASLDWIRYAFATSGSLVGISNTGGGSSSALSIQTNAIRGITYALAGTNSNTYLTNTATTLSQNISSNTFTNLTINSTGSITFITNTSSVPAAGTQTINSNSIVTAFNKTSAGGTVSLYVSNASSATGALITQTGNNFSNITVTGATTIAGWSNTDGGTPTKNISSNTFNAWTGGTSTVTGMNLNFNGGTTTFNLNTITNITGQGAITGMAIGSSGAATSVTANGNTITNLTSSGTGGTVTGISSASPATAVNISNNIINTLSTTAATVVGITSSGATTNIFQNQIYTLSTTNSSGVANGITNSGGTTVAIYKNKIADLSGSQAGSIVNGINVTSGTTLNISNNLIGDLRAPAATGLNAINGINAGASSTYNVYYNTIVLNATSASVTTFGNSCITFSSTAATFNNRNNILVNFSTPAQDGSNVAANGVAACLRRSSGTNGTVPTNYATTSNNNLYWVNPSAGTNNHLTYVEGTSTITNPFNTLPQFKTFLVNRDQASATETVSSSAGVFFQNFTASSPVFLHLVASITTQAESGAVNIASYTDDYDSEVRQGNGGYAGSGMAPDMGADEFAGVAADLSSPTITYTPLANTICLDNPALSATITDGSGVNILPMTKPRIWFKKKTNANSLPGTNDNTTNGWKYAEATNALSPFNFIIDYMQVFGGVAGGDTIQYFVVAQDNASIPNLGINSGTFAAPPPTVALNGGAFPLTGVINSYRIGVSIPTTVTIGASGATYTTLSGTGGLFSAINAGGLSGNTVVTILDATLPETGAVALNSMAYACGSGPYTLTIKPGTTVTTVLAGSSATPLIDINGADNVTFDGSNAGTTSKDMTIRNTGSAPAFRLINDATGNTIKNTIVESQNASSTSGTIFFSTSTGTLGNSNNTINNCDIRDRSDAAGVPANAVYSSGSVGALNGSNTVSGCNVFNWTNAGVLVETTGAGNGWTINPSHFYQTASRTTALKVISILGGSGHSILSNTIGGSAPDRSGSPMSTTSTFSGITLTVGTTSTTNVQGNTMSNLNISGGSSQTFKGINITAGNVNVGTTSGNILGGNAAVYDTIRTNYDSDLIENSGAGIVSIENNTIGNAAYYNAGGDRLFGIRGMAGTISIKNNIIRDLKSNGNSTGFSFFPGGIWLATTVAGANVEGNQVYNIAHSNAGTSAYTIAGIYVASVSSTGTPTTIIKNVIYNLTAAGAGTGTSSPRIWGIHVASGSATYANNMIAVGSTVGNESRIHGIEDLGTGANNYYFNSVSLTGTTGSGSNSSYAFRRSGTATVSILDNIFSNARTGGTGFHVSIANTNASATGWTATASNYNDLSNNVSTSLAQWLGTAAGNNRDLPGWQAAQGAGTPGSGGDLNSVSVFPVFTSTTDLHLTPANGSLDNYGNPAGGILTDIDGDTRSLTTPDMGADEFMAAPCSSAMGGTASLTGPSSFCGSGTPVITASGYSTGTGSAYQWMSSSASGDFPNSGSAVSGQTNPATLTTGSVSATKYYWLRVICTAGPDTMYSNLITITIYPSAAVITGLTVKCDNEPAVTLNETGGTGTSWLWSTTETTQSISVNPTMTTIYTVTVTSPGSCTATATHSVTVNPAPTPPIVNPITICNGTSGNLVVTNPVNDPPIVGSKIGSGTSTTSIPGPYRRFYGGHRYQMLYTASEILASGITAGQLVSLSFYVGSVPGGTTILDNVEIKLKNTLTATLGTTFETGATSVYTASSYQPVAGINTHTFNGSTFVWDGSSNLLVDFCFNSLTGATSTSTEYTTVTGSCTSYPETGNPNVCTNATGTTSTLRPNIRLEKFGAVATYTWNPGALSGISVNVSPADTTEYTVTAAFPSGCSSSSTVTVNVIPSPGITLGANPSVCSGITTANLTYSGTSESPDEYSINYNGAAEAQGFVDVTNAPLPASPIMLVVPGGAAPAIYSATLTVRNSTSGCVSSTTPITVTILPLPDAGTVNGATPLCVGATAFYTSSGDMNGTWSSANPAKATVDAMSGLVTAIAPGTTYIKYIASNGCGSPDADSLLLTIDSIVVANNNDVGAGSLRDIIDCAPSGSTITFAPAMSGQTIVLLTGEIVINKNLTIIGPGATSLTLSGNNSTRIFHLLSGYTLTLQDMGMKNATSVTNGGAIYVEGNLNLNNVLLQNNFEDGSPKSLTVTATANIDVTGMVDLKN